ncbi:hypothetical protein AS850_02885 [Frondihabitans sp. 762G35]|uniref:hypothetical protein n=1 Tax=Frondihabitans sp. 762G35 TaxID=1446794 RepID=UPI000D211455|nr:hypothetical protein [Frondihabitans sp. 762G35]ARC56018.1 hypothetical protein AS850_02885 [Frondihabitans sp. 762G35]
MSTPPTIDEIRARAEAAPRGPWHWAGNTKNHHTYLATWIPGWGRCSIMDFTRAGMHGAEPRFMQTDDVFMIRGRDLAIYEVAPTATTPDDPRVYRHDIIGYRHPTAEFIAHSREDIDTLLAEIDRLTTALAEAERAAMELVHESRASRRG